MSLASKMTFLALFATLMLSSCATTSQITEDTPQKLVQKLVEIPKKPQYIFITDKDAASISQKLWENEKITIRNLTGWNQGKTFASLGIGHFTWYPVGQEGPYEEKFLALLEFFQKQRISLPEWLQEQPDCPWNSRAEFYDNIDSAKMFSLRNLLKNTIPQQVQFIIKRLERNLPQMIAVLPTAEQRAQMHEQFYQVAQKPMGIYALVDYVKFKSEGTHPKKRYQDEGRGLLQVLENTVKKMSIFDNQ